MISSFDAPSIPKIKSGKDPFWEHGEKLDIPNTLRCKWCNHKVSGGITRLKQHLAKQKGQIASCEKVSVELQEAAKKALEAMKTAKEAKEAETQANRSEVTIGEGNVENCDYPQRPFLSGKVKGPMDKHVYLSPEEMAEKRKGVQSTLNEHWKKKEREDACEYICKFLFEAGISFNVVNLPSFDQMLEAIGMYGRGLKGPSMYEIGEKFLPIEKVKMDESLSSFKKTCKIHGCSHMTDAWTDRRGKSIMNLVVNCNSGTTFMKSKNASGDVHTARYICDFIIEGIDSLGGKENVVQVVTDNASNNMAAAKLLAVERPLIFWTCCAAHTINLMLKDISKIKPIQKAIMMGRTITVYIYNHTNVLDYMRKCTKGNDLVRPGITRFATSFLSLESLHENKKELRQMVLTDEWGAFTPADSEGHKQVTMNVISPAFWKKLKVLRRADSDAPSMGWLYGDLEGSKIEIAEDLDRSKKKYHPSWMIIDKRWDAKMKSPLHKVGYFLNPYFYYSKREEIENNGDLMDGFTECLFRMYPKDHDMQDKISKQLNIYQTQEGSLARQITNRQRQDPHFDPVNWWQMHGGSAPDLKKMAIRILSLTTSSSGCERAWSAFEMVHTKKRNRLTSEKLEDLVYVKFNSQLKSKFSKQNRDHLVAANMSNGMVSEWMPPLKQFDVNPSLSDVEDDDEVFPGEGLSWSAVARAMEVDTRPRSSSRRRTKIAKTSHGTSSLSRKGKRHMVEEEDVGSLSEENDTSTSESEDGEDTNED